MSEEGKNWVGYTIVVPNIPKGMSIHSARITGRYGNDWWWKCADCYSGAGVYTSATLEEYEEKGWMVSPQKSDKDLTGITTHPNANGDDGWEYYYA